jgi:YHS domain-containing protein
VWQDFKMNIKVIFGLIAAYLLYKLYRSWKNRGRTQVSPPAAGEDLVEDSQCHAYVPVSSACCSVIEGKKHYFCSQMCLDAYTKAKKR